MSSINRARVILVGNGRMGKIRASLLYANPRFEISGIVDTDISAASALADTYRVSFLHRECIYWIQPLPTKQSELELYIFRYV